MNLLIDKTHDIFKLCPIIYIEMKYFKYVLAAWVSCQFDQSIKRLINLPSPTRVPPKLGYLAILSISACYEHRFHIIRDTPPTFFVHD